MFNQREKNLYNLLIELRGLKENFERHIPLYTASLDSAALMPVEFGRRCWAYRVDALTQRVKIDYEKYQVRVTQANLLGKAITPLRDGLLKTFGMEPAPPPDSLRPGVSISAPGRIEPTLLDNLSKRTGVLYLTFEEFETTAQRLKGEILRGVVRLKNEQDIPGLIFKFASQPPEESKGK